MDRNDSTTIPEVTSDDFARRFSMRGPNLMWFLGAGTSASAGIPTAYDLIWEFKRQLYVTQRRANMSVVSDLSSPGTRDLLQSHINSLETGPILDSPEEYAVLFELVFPAESDRRTFIDSKIGGAKPSYGHAALAALMKQDRTRIVWTTNFDPLVADACAKIFDGTGNLTTAALDAPNTARDCINDGRWPLEIKLHGDFRSRKLKNTPDELRHQDEQMRQLLVDSCGRFGLIVAGYSGRDNSIMNPLEAVLDLPNPFPSGLFWLHRGDGPPFSRVEELLARASSLGIDGGLVRIPNFDEALRDVVRTLPELDLVTLDGFGTERPRCTDASVSVGKVGWPVIRLNAIEVTRMPTVCRRVVCTIEGHKEVREAVERAGVDVIFTRVRAGVLLFGSDAESRTPFEDLSISEFDLHAIEPRRLRYDSGERGLLRDALSRALARNCDLIYQRHRSGDQFRPADSSNPKWKELKTIVSTLSGTVSGSELQWYEGVVTRLDWADERLWLLVEPRTIFEGINKENKRLATDFARERSVRRYNRTLNDLIDFWTRTLSQGGQPLKSLGCTDGVDASFELSTTNGFSRRIGI